MDAAPPIQPDRQPLPTGWAVPWSLLVLAGPIIASMCSRTAMSFVDFVMVSELGTEAQAAIMPAGVLLFCVFGFGTGVLTALSTFVSQSFGRDAWRDCGAYAWQGVYLSLSLAVAALACWPAIRPLFELVGHAPTVREMEIIYVKIGLISVAPTLIAVAITNFFNGIHKPGIGLGSMVISNIANALLNWVLIFGKFGFPAMGIAGAAWGTAIASMLQAIILIAWMLRPAAAARFHTRSTWRVDWNMIRSIVRVGFPAGVQFTMEIAAFTIFTLVLVGQFTTEQLAANNLVFKCLEVSFMPAVGLGAALTNAVGKAIGQGNRAHARLVTRWACVFNVCYMGLIGTIYLFNRHRLPGLFSDDPQVIAWSAKLLIFCAVFQVFDALNITHVSAMRGAGDNQFAAIISAVLAGTVFIGGGWFAVVYLPHWGVLGPWTAATAYIVILGIAMTLRWRHDAWERITLIPGTMVVAAEAHEVEIQMSKVD